MSEDEPRRGMTDEEQELADRLYAAIQQDAIHTDRGAQAKAFRVGVSDLGYCSERTRRMLNQEHPGEEPDMFLAWIGTALGDRFEDAVAKSFPGAIKQAETVTTLVGDRRTYDVLGHPDLILPEEGIVLDGKTAYGLQMARRVGADQQKQFQRHLYGAGAWDAGYFGDRPISEVRVGNVWIDRSGMERAVHVQIEPFDYNVLVAAAHWLEEVVEHYTRGTVAEKEPPREVCESTCGFFQDCRAFDTDVTGLLEGPRTLEAVQLYLDGKAAESWGKKARAESKSELVGIGGSTGKHIVRWVHVEGNDTRAGYSRLDIRAIK